MSGNIIFDNQEDETEIYIWLSKYDKVYRAFLDLNDKKQIISYLLSNQDYFVHKNILSLPLIEHCCTVKEFGNRL